jgi:hypothetical protein
VNGYDDDDDDDNCLPKCTPYLNQYDTGMKTVASMKIIAFWDAAPCSLMEVNRHFIGAYCTYHHSPDDGAASQKAVIFRKMFIRLFLISECR